MNILFLIRDTPYTIRFSPIPIRREVVIIYQEFRDAEERMRERCRGVLLAVRLNYKKKDDEFRVVRGKIPEEGMQVDISTDVTAARFGYLGGARFGGDRIVVLFQFPV